ncbi:MAG: WbuC family cupin fold metalloprotein [Bacteroidaceae bacterium]|nr:WbuC family cupin fold metalloprotein [Bacteroidaceae bacterium]
MRIDNELLESLTKKAEANERLRMNLDMRTSPEDTSQRMLNAIEPGSILPIHRHRFTTETVVMVKGSLKETFYNDKGEVTDIILMQAGGECPMIQIPAGQWHTAEALEPGTVIFEAKDGAYVPLSQDDVLEV